VLVKVDNVSKRFCRSLKRSLWYGLQDLGSEICGGRHGGGSGLPESSADVPLRPDEFWAVKDVSFALRRGECLGLIGRNGAGKTTLLRMLNGLIKPDTGRIEMTGKMRALIALGAGYNPILTGRENIYISGRISGMSKKETDAKMDQIIEFAEIGGFIDSPVQTYSSGMVVRLGYAAAAFMNPDILILDEVLAVGDHAFRSKCYENLGKLLPDTATIIVSHSENQIGRLCTSAILLEDGSKKALGNPHQILDIYIGALELNRANEGPKILSNPYSATINLRLSHSVIDFGGTLIAEIESSLDLSDHSFTIQIQKHGVWCSFSNPVTASKSFDKAGYCYTFQLGPIQLSNGIYDLGLLIESGNRRSVVFHSEKHDKIQVRRCAYFTPDYIIPAKQV
jgi:ABC-type polysaccharide/polyol phosphate transport system ATPase subunit